MGAGEIHEGDIGTEFEATIKDGTVVVDLSTATSLQLLFKKPDGTVLTKTATFSTDGTDGKIVYTAILGDLDFTGDLVVQAKVGFSGGVWHSDLRHFQVFESLA